MEARFEAHPKARHEAGSRRLSTEVVGPGRAPPSTAHDRSEDQKREGRQHVTGSARNHETEVSKISGAGVLHQAVFDRSRKPFPWVSL
jgi:hypothetical protein